MKEKILKKLSKDIIIIIKKDEDMAYKNDFSKKKGTPFC